MPSISGNVHRNSVVFFSGSSLIRQGLRPCHLPRRGRRPSGGGNLQMASSRISGYTFRNCESIFTSYCIALSPSKPDLPAWQSLQLHIQQRVRISLLITVGSFICFKTQMFIKSHCLGVLLIHCNLFDSIFRDTVLNKLLSDSTASF